MQIDFEDGTVVEIGVELVTVVAEYILKPLKYQLCRACRKPDTNERKHSPI